MNTNKLIKSVTFSLATVIAASAAVSVTAAEKEDGHLDVCMEQLRGFYGDDTEFTLIKQRRFKDGVRMQVAARIDQDNSKFANCWVANDEIPAYGYENNQEMVASAETPESK